MNGGVEIRLSQFVDDPRRRAAPECSGELQRSQTVMRHVPLKGLFGWPMQRCDGREERY
jgi:hypothetical protein